MQRRRLRTVVVTAFVWLVGAMCGATARAADGPAIAPEGMRLIDAMPLINQALADPQFLSQLDTDEAARSALRKELADATFRRFGDTRSVRVEMWRGTSTEQPMILLEYQTSWKLFP